MTLFKNFQRSYSGPQHYSCLALTLLVKVHCRSHLGSKARVEEWKTGREKTSG